MELIKITSEGKQAVSAKELYDNIGFEKAHWAKWYKKNILSNQFAIEGVDYTSLTLGVNVNGTPNVDFALTPDFAKKLAMVARTEEGEKVRNYFLACEQKALSTSIPKVFSLEDALEIALNKTREAKKLEEKLEVQKPKVESHNHFISSDRLLNMEEAAKSLNIGRNKLFVYLRNIQLLQPNSLPYQRFIDQGLFKVKQTPIKKGEKVEYYAQTFVTAKGLDYISRRMHSQNQLLNLKLIS